MVIETPRFGRIDIAEDEIITMPQGMIGFVSLRRYCLFDPADDMLITWLQSIDDPRIAFPVLEPSVFYQNYRVQLSPHELRDLNLGSLQSAAVLCVITIPDDTSQMTANMKAPIVVNVESRCARQVVLQDNAYAIRHPMFRELRAHLVTIASLQGKQEKQIVSIRDLQPSRHIEASL